jgi:hypothetical protein
MLIYYFTFGCLFSAYIYIARDFMVYVMVFWRINK